MLGIWMHLPPQRQAAGSSCCAGKEEEGGKCALKHSQCSNGICTTNDCAGVGAGGESWAAAGEGLDEDSAKGRSRGSMGMNNNFGRSKYIYYCGVMELCIFCVEGATTLFVWW